MDMDSLMEHYFQGEFSKFSSYLEGRLEATALRGDAIQLGRVLAHYGCIQIYLGNEYKVETITQQILDEYSRESLDPRIAAGFARCLALYSVFQGDIIEAERYYMEARRWYRLTDWYGDEILMLLEANYWLYFYMENWSEAHYTVERWEQIGLFYDELKCFKSLYKFYKEKDLIGLGEFPVSQLTWISKIKWQVLDPQAGHPDCHYHAIVALLNEVAPLLIDQEWEKAGFLVDQLEAKARLWKHPWYRALSSYLKGIIRLHCHQPYESSLAEAMELFHRIQRKDLADLCQQLIQNQTSSGQGLFQCIPSVAIREIDIRKPMYRFTLFDSFQIFYEDQPIPLPKWGRKKAEELLLFLLTQPGYRCLRDQVIEQLFGDEDLKKSANQLYVTINRLNQVWATVLEQTEAHVKKVPLIRIDQGIVLLESNYIENVDVQQYLKLVSVGKHLWHQDREVALDLFEQARMIYNEEVLQEYLYFDWLTTYREEIRYQHVFLLNKLLESAKQTPEEVTKIESLLQELHLAEPLNESYAQQLMEYLLDIGKKVEARWIFQTYQRRIEKELGMPPMLQWEQWLEKRGC